MRRRRIRAAVASAARRPGARLALTGALLAGLVTLTGAVGAFVVPAATGTGARSAATPQATGTIGGAFPSDVAAPGMDGALPTIGGSPPSGTATPAPTGTGRPADALAGWASQVSAKVGVPTIAMQAYGYAELVLANTLPNCRLSWTTLAAIGKVESDHGRTGAASLETDGRALPPILGPPLDGQGGRGKITDTDSGALDGDRTWDRAVGPMQFIPSTWNNSAVDADNDGRRDPNDIDDAALAAANYLCRAGRDLTKPADWWAAIRTYNDVQRYAQAVFDTANEYGTKSRT